MKTSQRRRAAQLDLPGLPRHKTQHGGSLSRGKRKTRRPLTTKRSLHVVLKSERARGRRALINHSALIKARIQTAAKRFHVRVHGRAVHFNHIHLHVEGRTRVGLQNFFRVVSGHIAQRILQLFPLKPHERNQTLPGNRQFWRDLLFSRIVAKGRDFRNVAAYLHANIREVEEWLGVVTTILKVDTG